MNGMIPISGTYDDRLVVLSVAIAIVASYAALDLAGRVTANRGRARMAWLSGGALAMGSGIWAMHYTGMLAFRLPIPVYYHLPTVLFSLLAAVLASLTALHFVSHERITPLRLTAGSVLMGAGIATMHYSGMAAMRMAAMPRYHRGLWTLSVVLAIVISFVGLLLISCSRHENRGGAVKAAIAVVIGLAMPVMHYTGMAAVTFMRTGLSPDLSRSVEISALTSSAIIVVTFVILGFVVMTSLVDRRLSAQQLKLDSERTILRTLIDNMPDFMFVKDRQGRFVIANTHTARVLGANSVDDLVGKTVFDLFPKELAEAYTTDDQEVIRSGCPLFNREENGVDREGNITHLLTTKVPIRGANGAVSGIAGVARDISSRKRNEDALRAAHQKAEIFINAVPSILIGMDRDSRITRWNSAAAACFGLGEADLVGKQLGSCGVKWQQANMQDEIQSWCSEQKSRRCDRVPFVLNGEVRLLGLTIRSIHIADENPTELLVIGSDITDRTMLEDQLRQAQKLESVGQLAAGIAHEINTPTQYIGDNVRFLKESFQCLKSLLANYERLLTAANNGAPSRETVQEVAAEVERADAAYLLEEIPRAIEQTLEGVTRVSTLVSAMKEFSHPGTKEKILLDLNRAIESTITVARNEWKYVAEMETDLDPTLPLIPCQPGEFNQVILNLLVNAAHAITDVVGKGGSKKGTIKVQTRNGPECAEIRIQDTGTGIPEELRARIFDPFFTTKEIGKGTGQGLAIARSVVVDKHDGTIHFESEEGRGTTFIIRLPHESKLSTGKAVSA
jgi:PAS domain S-box-containing protein